MKLYYHIRIETERATILVIVIQLIIIRLSIMYVQLSDVFYIIGTQCVYK